MDDRDKLKKIALFALAGIIILFVIMISIALPLILMIKVSVWFILLYAIPIGAFLGVYVYYEEFD